MSSDQDLAKDIEFIAKQFGGWSEDAGSVIIYELSIFGMPNYIAQHPDAVPALCAFACWASAKLPDLIWDTYIRTTDSSPVELVLVTTYMGRTIVSDPYDRTDPLGRSKAIIQLVDRVLAMEDES